jgi:hypothetical protein
MNDETTINERPRKRLTRLEWSAKKKAIARDLSHVINQHGFDNHLDVPDFLLADIAISAMYNFGNFRRKADELEFDMLNKQKEAFMDGDGPDPFGDDDDED